MRTANVDAEFCRSPRRHRITAQRFVYSLDKILHGQGWSLRKLNSAPPRIPDNLARFLALAKDPVC